MNPPKLRLLITEKCNRSCPGCCNKEYDLSALPVETDFTGYEMVSLTGGEPMLYPTLIAHIANRIRKQNSTAKIVLYTAHIENWHDVEFVLGFIDGLTVTLHEQKDTMPFYVLNYLLEDKLKSKSLRLNIFKGITVGGSLKGWDVKRDIEWIKDCPLPDGEVFKRI